MALISITLPIRPTTKKTSNQIIRVGGFSKIMPSKIYLEWFKTAMTYAIPIKNALQRQGIVLPLRGPVVVAAVFYRERAAGDLNGFEQALADWLQEPRYSKTRTNWAGIPKRTRDGCGLIGDDSQIVSWDGSRLDKDASNPRIEFTIDPWQQGLELFPEEKSLTKD